MKRPCPLVPLLVALIMLIATVVPLLHPPVTPSDLGSGPPTTDAGLYVNQEYVVSGTESWISVKITTFGHLVIPEGTTLSTSQMTMEGLATVDLTGGDLVISPWTAGEVIGINGTCRHMRVTDGSSITIEGRDGSNRWNGQGVSVEMNVRASREILIENASVVLSAGDGMGPDTPVTLDDLDGRWYAGGDARFVLRTTLDFASLAILNSTVLVRAGVGGDAPDGVNSDDTAQVLGGGYTQGGSVSDRVGSGGAAFIGMTTNKVDVQGSVVHVVGGDGGDAGDGGSVRSNAGLGTGGGGYSGGPGASDPEHPAGPGGQVSGRVGVGGDSTLNILAVEVSMQASEVAIQAGDGGDAGEGGDTAGLGGAGGGGYSGGGGGSHESRNGGANGGTVEGHVGSGGDATATMLSHSIYLSDGILNVTAGQGGKAGDGGTSTGPSGAGGGGLSGGGGAGWIPSASDPLTVNGGSGGTVEGDVASGGDARLEVTSTLGTFFLVDVNVHAGGGGPGGRAGRSHMMTARNEWRGGGGGGSYSGGGGGGIIEDGLWISHGGGTGVIEQGVGDGGDASMRLVVIEPVIHANNHLSATRGDGGFCWRSAALGPTGGEGTGRMTSKGRAHRYVPMSMTALQTPWNGHESKDVPLFTWSPVHGSTTNGDVWGYRFQLALDPEFDLVTLTSDVPYPYANVSGTRKGELYWRVATLYSRPPKRGGPWSEPFEFTHLNSPPSIMKIPQLNISVRMLKEVDLGPYIYDVDDPKHDLKLSSGDPAVMSITDLMIRLHYPSYEEPHQIEFIVSDGYETTVGLLPVRVIDRNHDPDLLAVGDYNLPAEIEMQVGEELVLDVLTIDKDGDWVQLSIGSDWDGASILGNGSLRLSADTGDLGTHRVTLSGTDGRGGSASEDITVHVTKIGEPPLPPIFLAPRDGSSFDEGTPVTFRISVEDPDFIYGEMVTLTLISNISGILLTVETDREVEFTVNDLTAGTHRISAIVTDGTASARSETELLVMGKPEAQPVWGPTEDANVIVILVLTALALLLLGFLIGHMRRRR